jgi:hypothetical protein
MSFATLLSWVSGLALVAPGLPPATVVGTALVLHTCDAVLCRLFARNNGHPPGLCTVLGFVGGIWAVAVLILLPRRRPTPSH